MALASPEAQLGAVPCYRNSPVRCGDAEFSAQSRHLATLLTIEGDVDGRNSDELYRRCARFILPGTALLLDTSGVSSFSQEGVELVDRLDDECRAAGIEWVIVASRAVAERLDVDADARSKSGDAGGADRPFAPSVAEALHRIADSIYTRRRLLMPYLTKTA